MTSNTVLASEDWQITEEGQKPVSLLVNLRRSSLVFPWFRFVYAEGDDSNLQIIFSTHLVTIGGQGLETLLQAVAAQRVISITQPTENEAKFGVRGPNATPYEGPSIHSIEVQKFE